MRRSASTHASIQLRAETGALVVALRHGASCWSLSPDARSTRAMSSTSGRCEASRWGESVERGVNRSDRARARRAGLSDVDAPFDPDRVIEQGCLIAWNPRSANPRAASGPPGAW
jgi:hypothetical protein